MLSPRQFGTCLGFAGAVSLTIGIIWASIGFWLVFYFVLLECFVLVVAFICYAYHATDRETVRLTKNEILFEFEVGGKTEKRSLPRFQVNARMSDTDGGRLVEFRWGKKVVRVGRMVDLKSREKFFGEIKGHIC